MAGTSSKKQIAVTAEINGETQKFLLFQNLDVLNSFLQKHSCRPLLETERGWKFCPSLPQQVREEMQRSCALYAVVPNTQEEKIYFYISGYRTLERKLKYLRPLSKENVEIDIDGNTYSYFMTNDEKTLHDVLLKCGVLFIPENEWKVNYALHKNVTDKMSELGAKYSITFSHNSYILNRYEENVPYIVHINELAKKQKGLMPFAILNATIKDDDVRSLEKFSRGKSSERFLKNTMLLKLCARHNAKKSMEFMIKFGADVNAQDKHGVTPLMAAAAIGSKDIVCLLLKNGADKTLKAKNGWTAFVYALANNNNEIARLLSEKDSYSEFQENIDRMDFHDKLGFFIARFISSGEKEPCDIYKNVCECMSRKTFSKIRSSKSHPKKKNVLLLAIGLRLSLKDAESLLMSAGYVLSEKEEFDKIVKKHLQDKSYNIFDINSDLYTKTGTSFYAYQE